MHTSHIWAWRIIFTNPVMGFRKTVAADAANLGDALVEGRIKLQEQGYKSSDFEVVEVKRGTVVH